MTADTGALKAALDRLSALHPRVIDLSLERLERLLEALGRPQDRLPPVIHVAGTNGKGSTVAFLRAIMATAGKRAHAYTSPHLIRFSERIVLGGAAIAEEALANLLDRVERANAGGAITFFEATTAAALTAFAEESADFTLLEVGLGGRFDATNVIGTPACAVITPVGLDHQEFLGSDLGQIAREKAGVMKPGAPVVIGPQQADALAVLLEEAQRVGAAPIGWGSAFDGRLENGRLVVETEDELLDLRAPNLHGAHQVQNAAVAVMAARAVGVRDRATLSEGVGSAHWPGRLQRLSSGPLVDAARSAGAVELWLDGAHNPLGARALAQALADLNDRDPRPLVLVCGLQTTKDAATFFEVFQGLARDVITVEPTAASKAFDPEDLASIARGTGLAAHASDDLEAALGLVRHLVEPDEAGARVVICGSLYLVGEALARQEGVKPSAG